VAVISDGSTDITLEKADEKVDFGVIEAFKLSASGAIKSQTSGERFKLKCKFRTNSGNLRALLNLLKNGSDYYYYTPEDEHGIYSDLTYPLQCNFSKLKHVWGYDDIFYGSFTVESVDYM
jgi:hypothetical protein